MNKITNIEEQKRNKERVNIYVDNDYAFSLSKEVLLKEKIKVNDIIDMEKMKNHLSKEWLMPLHHYSNLSNVANQFQIHPW